MRPRPVHSDAAHRAITAELVRLSLGGRPERPELLGWMRYSLLDALRRSGRRKGRRR